MQNRFPGLRPLWQIGGIVVLLVIVLLALVFTIPQDESDPSDTDTLPQAASASRIQNSYPATLQRGGCDVLEPQPVLQLNALDRQQDDGSSNATFASVTEAEVAPADLVDQTHRIVVTAESDDQDLGIALACGEISGDPSSSSLVVGLTSYTTGDLAGVAVLTSVSDQQTRTELYLILGESGTTIGQDPVVDEPQNTGGDGNNIEEVPESSDL